MVGWCDVMWLLTCFAPYLGNYNPVYIYHSWFEMRTQGLKPPCKLVARDFGWQLMRDFLTGSGARGPNY